LGEPTRPAKFAAIEARVRGIRGYTESSSRGDGSDWFEAELTPDLVAEVRSRLDASIIGPDRRVLNGRDAPHDTTATPRWWPDHWPAGTVTYWRGHSMLILPPTGTRAWLIDFRL